MRKTLRDEFAIAALVGIISNSKVVCLRKVDAFDKDGEVKRWHLTEDQVLIAEDAYSIADAMIIVRKGEQ